MKGTNLLRNSRRGEELQGGELLEQVWLITGTQVKQGGN